MKSEGMKINRRQALAAGGAIAIAKSKIDAKRSPNVDFSPIKTYIWLPSPPLTLQAT